ncbi:MAG: hypothetical protein QN193_06970 [Armatimonadota bacterium]|nr:hypothetical protein [Armatimonadota bacterium]MDR7444563.1 hypothetical protein [Armatimonadota bacterium]MDR7570331.1 hypothetical protein [Armatimonadota bacterium]MDR7615353.1 hypothetical protein [Armatimonadota bacterium]
MKRGRMPKRPTEPTQPPDPLEGILRRRLYRLHCPPPERLGEWRLGLLQAPEVQDHLITCPRCQEELRWLEALLGGGVHGAPRRALTLRPAPPLLAAFALRGADSSSRTTYAGEEYTLTVEVAQDLQNPACRSVFGILGGQERPRRGEAILSSLSASFSAPVDESGQFALFQVPVGHYELRILFEELEILVESLEIR